MSSVCPECCIYLDEENGKCPHCYKKVNNGDWPDDIPALVEKNLAYKGGHIPLEGGILRGAPSEILLDNMEERRVIGSSKDDCDIQIENAEPIHAVIYKRPGSDEWWIANACPKSPAKVNGQDIINLRLYRGDRISVAGVSFLFNGDRLLTKFKKECTGVSIEVKDLTVKKKGADILKDVCFKIQPGEFVGLLGPSGCGKSSVLERIIGLADFNEGSIKINQVDYSENKDILPRLTAFVMQDVEKSLHHDFTLLDEIRSFCSIRGIRKDQKEVDDVLDLVGLKEKKNDRVGSLSGGQKRRVGIALELLRDPLLFALDEPTAGLDPATETDVMKYLKHIAQQGKTVLCSTHIMGNLDLFDKILLLAKGRVVFFGTPAELKEKFGEPEKDFKPLILYRQLAGDSDAEQIRIADDKAREYRGSETCSRYADLVLSDETLPGREPIPVLTSFTGYLKRQFLDFISFSNSGHPFLTFWTSALFLQVFFQPILAAFVIKWACADYFCAGTESFDLFFFCSLAVFWLGLNNAVREFVKERVPWRCLERLEKVSFRGYILAKIVWSVILSLVQVSIFTLIVFALPRVIQPKSVADWQFPFSNFIVLFMVCICGSLIALGVSAFFKKENSAIALLPIILIPILFFSKTIVRFDEYKTFSEVRSYVANDDKKNYAPLSVYLATLAPCHQPAHLMDMQIVVKLKNEQEIKRAQIPSAWKDFLLSFFIYSSIALLCVFLFQWWNEKNWHGR